MEIQKQIVWKTNEQQKQENRMKKNGKYIVAIEYEIENRYFSLVVLKKYFPVVTFFFFYFFCFSFQNTKNKKIKNLFLFLTKEKYFG